ncbi:MAG: hypothetical protein E1N59_41 [Puniceicoccaceae bacterium 5H]|nr:MAG: hypothetical protein E1N59_41 [Puniceicoccaceae bacterium 5H]
MHIEPGLIDGPKMALSYGTAAVSFSILGKLALDHIKEKGLTSFAAKSLAATVAVFTFFQVFFHVPVGVSEVHLILGTSLLLMLGAAPAALGLAAGLLIQGLFFAPFDLPQYGANITTLLVPLFAMQWCARRVVEPNQAYVDLRYSQVFKLSAIYQGGIVSWVAFWAFYGQGFGAESVQSVASFGAAYMSVVLIEPLADLGLLALARAGKQLSESAFARTLLNDRLYRA